MTDDRVLVSTHGRRHAAPAATAIPLRALHPARRATLAISAFVDIAQGLGYALGISPTTSANLILLAGIAPLWLWGLSLIVAGMFLLTSWRFIGEGLGAVVWMVWCAFIIITLVNHTATGWGWPSFAGFAALHLALLWFYYQNRREGPWPARRGT